MFFPAVTTEQFLREAWKSFTPVTNFESLEWPENLQPEVEKYGSERVFRAGLEALGYPPTWAHSSNEYQLIFEKLEK